jgi:hypothetical protein
MDLTPDSIWPNNRSRPAGRQQQKADRHLLGVLMRRLSHLQSACVSLLISGIGRARRRDLPDDQIARGSFRSPVAARGIADANDVAASGHSFMAAAEQQGHHHHHHHKAQCKFLKPETVHARTKSKTTSPSFSFFPRLALGAQSFSFRGHDGSTMAPILSVRGDNDNGTAALLVGLAIHYQAVLSAGKH